MSAPSPRVQQIITQLKERLGPDRLSARVIGCPCGCATPDECVRNRPISEPRPWGDPDLWMPPRGASL